MTATTTTDMMNAMNASNATAAMDAANAPGDVARWFTGRDNQPRAVRARLRGDQLELTAVLPADADAATSGNPDADATPGAAAGPILLTVPRATLSVGERWQDGEVPVALPDGGTLWLPHASALAIALAPRGLATRLAARLSGAICCAVALAALVIWFDRQGAGLMARAALPLIPLSLDRAIGARVEHELNATWLRASKLPQARQEAISDRFYDMADRLHPELPLTLKFGRPTARSGFNALALPNGTIVFMDGMAQALDDDQLMAVLAHEASHVKHRHATRAVVQAVGLFAVASAVLGDYSSLAASTLAGLQTLRYSRDAEREADADAQAALRQEQLPPDTLVKVWRSFERQLRHEGVEQEDEHVWMSSHPSIGERIESAEQAARADRR